jgi:hypothetical protein
MLIKAVIFGSDGFGQRRDGRLKCPSSIAEFPSPIIDGQFLGNGRWCTFRRRAPANLSLSAAVKLRDSLDKAITLDTRQTALWSDTASTSRVGRRAV